MRTVKILVWVVLMTAFSCSEVSNKVSNDEQVQGPVKVEIIEVEGKYSLKRGGEPYIIEGAGFEFGNMESLVDHGANSFRTWRTDNGEQSGQQVLDSAYMNGLTVSMCLDVQRERHGFDYDDEAAVQAQFDKMKAEVLKYKDHPALLFWVIGNELNHQYENPKVYDAVNDISKMIHELDPNHPTTTTIAGINLELISVINERAYDIDALSIQLYGDLVNLPDYIETSKWTKPYLVTEWGATGHWEVSQTPWGAPIEHNSSMKADNYLKGYQKAIEPYGDQCIGSYVFLWGQKQERTPTWYGMFLSDGFETESIDVMHYIWNGDWPVNRTPRLKSFGLNQQFAYDNVYLEANSENVASVEVFDYENDTISYVWEVKPESTEQTEGGDHEDDIASLSGLIAKDVGSNIEFIAPAKPGAYRLFVYAFDGHGNAAHANIPFFVN